jgi:glutamate carboxypeptidase
LRELVGERLGRPAAEERIGGDGFGDVAVLDYPGTDGSSAPLVLLGHYDTVWPIGTLADRPFEVTADRIAGPGVFDMKAGLVQMLWALRIAREQGIALPPVRLVLNGDEEIGSPVSRPVIERAAAGARAGLVFEPAGPGGALKTARKGTGLFRVSVTGTEAHAGLDPTAGASAIDELARTVLAVRDAADLDRGTSVNVGVIAGGTRSNVIAGRAHCDLDVRVSAPDETRRIDRVLDALATRTPGTSLQVEGGWNRPVMQRSAGTAALVGTARGAAAEIGVAVHEVAVGGASDGNFLAALGVPVLDGLGAVGDGAHARHEHVATADVVPRTAFAARFLGALAG